MDELDSNVMTDPDGAAQRIRDALKDTTPGPWVWEGGKLCGGRAPFSDKMRVLFERQDLWDFALSSRDVDLVANAPSLLKEALDCIETCQEKLAKSREKNDEAVADSLRCGLALAEALARIEELEAEQVKL